MTRTEELKMIEDAIAAGKIRYCRPGEISQPIRGGRLFPRKDEEWAS